MAADYTFRWQYCQNPQLGKSYGDWVVDTFKIATAGIVITLSQGTAGSTGNAFRHRKPGC